MKKLVLLFALALFVPLALAANSPVLPVEDFVALDDFDEVALSTNGEYLAATVPLPGRTAMVVIRLSDMKRVAAVQHGADKHIYSIRWVGPDKLVYYLGEKALQTEQLVTRGELYIVNADGSGAEMLIGQRAGIDQVSASNVRRGRRPEKVVARVVDILPGDSKTLVLAVYGESLFPTVERMNIVSGQRIVVAKSPVRRGSFLLDHAGNVRFALGGDDDRTKRLYHRNDDKSEWELVNDEAVTGLSVAALGFSSDDRTAYLYSEQAEGPDVILAFDPASKTSKILQRDDNASPHEVLYSPTDGSPYGVIFMDGLPRAKYFDPDSQAARLHRSLQASFQGQLVEIGRIRDGQSKGLMVVHGDRNPGDFYLFDHASKKASYLLARNARLDPDQMAATTPFSFKARDGQLLHGYLTLPKGSEGKKLPLVVNPHGGPMGIADVWGFDSDVQLLASRGFAVLRVNFRGSGNHGRAFERAGYRQWGGRMQDDLTDATRWAIAEGIADPQRICIYGASYGGYAALMGAVKEPDLYRCAAGHVGVYDLNMMYGEGDIAETRMGRRGLEETLGREGLDAASPVKQAGRIRIPVLLTASDDDERAPDKHTERMRDALLQAGKTVETKIYEGEGHSFTLVSNRIDFQKRLLDFLSRHLQPAPSTP